MASGKLVVSTYVQYILIALGVFLLIGFFQQIGGVLLTFLMAAVLAYLLNPLVRMLEGYRIPRVIAVLSVFALLTVVVIAVFTILIIPAVRQVQNIINAPEVYVNQLVNLVEEARKLPYVGERIAAIDAGMLLQFAQSNAPSPGSVLNAALGVIGGVFGIFGTILNLLLMMVISIYMLLDRERITRAVLRMIPSAIRGQMIGLFGAVEVALIKYVRAQIILCLIMGVIGWAIVFFTGGSYALFIGVWVGLMELVPILGAFMGAIPAVLLALLDSPVKALVVAGLFLLAQQLEGNVLVPKIMGGSVGVHPLWVMFAMLSATALYGLVGAIFAVPVVAIIAAAIKYLQGTLIFERWRKAPIMSVDAGAESVDALENMKDKE